MLHPEERFERHLRYARGEIARSHHVRRWSLFAIQLIARRCLHQAPPERPTHAALVREAELLLAGVMSSQVDPRLFHAGGLVLAMKLYLAGEPDERMALAARARQLFDAALAAGEPETDLLLDYAIFELDVDHGGDVTKALALLARAGEGPGERQQVERLRERLSASLRDVIQRSA